MKLESYSSYVLQKGIEAITSLRIQLCPIETNPTPWELFGFLGSLKGGAPQVSISTSYPRLPGLDTETEVKQWWSEIGRVLQGPAIQKPGVCLQV